MNFSSWQGVNLLLKNSPQITTNLPQKLQGGSIEIDLGLHSFLKGFLQAFQLFQNQAFKKLVHLQFKMSKAQIF